VTVSKDMLRALAVNATRHLTDADFHLKRSAVPSAMSSAVFAIEELGKLYYIVTMGELPPPKVRGDHRANAVIYVAMLYVAVSLPRVSEWSQILRVGYNPAVPLTEVQQQAIERHPELAQFMDQLKSGQLVDPNARVQAFGIAAAAKETRDGTFEPWLRLVKRGLQDFRLAATYVDEKKDSPGSWNDPQAVDPDVTQTLYVSGLLFLVLVFALA
jgi:hypothetical protein